MENMKKDKTTVVIFIAILLYFLLPDLIFAETIQFESGRRIEGKVIQKTTDKIRVDIGGGVMRTYNVDEVKSIDGRSTQVYRPNMNSQPEEEDLLSAQEKYPFLKGRTLMYTQRYDEAIIEFNKAIAVDPGDANAYYNRARVYFLIKEYNKAWEDVHTAKMLGYDIDLEFIEELKKASARDE